MPSEDDQEVAALLATADEIEIVIDKLVAGGDGFGHWQGISIFVPRSAPGDRLRVKLFERRPHYGRARIVEILEPGPGRRQAPCSHFDACGGCDLQHLEDELQGRLKVAAARETLERLGHLDSLPEARFIEGASWGYRLRTQLRTESPDVEPTAGTPPAATSDAAGTDPATAGTPPAATSAVRVGYFARGSHELVAIGECPILLPELEAHVVSLPASLPANAPRRLDLAAGDDGLTCAPLVDGQPHGPVRRRVGDVTLSFDSGCFFQAHAGLLRDLAEAVCGPWRGERAFDFYAGVGLFSLLLAKRYESVTAIEGDRSSARFARNNARTNRLPNVEVVSQSLETWIGVFPEGVDRVVVNPPRAGLSNRVRTVLRLKPPARLTYLSCHPATLARDLQRLDDLYQVEELTFFDLFPQTGHLETLVQLCRR